MLEQLGAGSTKFGEINATIEEQPNACPICHHAIVPLRLTTRLVGPQPGRIEVVYQCTSDPCQGVFIAVHSHQKDPRSNAYYKLEKTWPRTAQTDSFSEEISGVSPTFVTIHQQAMEAEAAELDQLTGIGLRKALEFLVKDFAINRNQDAEDAIRSLALGKVITNYLDDPNLRRAAERAAWLGNDETHYTRRWTQHDIEDLKRLVRLTVNWIENVILTDQYAEDMDPSASS